MVEGTAQTILLLTLITIIGVLLGKVKVFGIKFGNSFVFFAAIFFGHFANKIGIQTNQAMMDFAKNFGLILFVYTLGLQVGPGFFSSIRRGGLQTIGSSLLMILLGSGVAVIIALFSDTGIAESIGLLSGAVTNTASLIAAQQTVLDIDPSAVEVANNVGSAYAVAYPFSVLGAVLSVVILCKIFPKSVKKSAEGLSSQLTEAIEVEVIGPEFIGKSVREIVKNSGLRFVISRLWRKGKVQIPISDTIIKEGDHLLLIINKDDEQKIDILFGRHEDRDWNRPDIDWDAIDKNLVSSYLYVTQDDVIGKSIEKLKLRNRFGVNITRIMRSSVVMVPSARTRLEFGDRLTVVGEPARIKELTKFIGNEDSKLQQPHIVPLLVGIFLGVFIGSIPIAIPGMSTPLKLGIAGGPIVIGILMGAFGPKVKLATYANPAAAGLVKQLGITSFYASLGFGVGGNFIETVFCMQGLKWAGLAIAIAVIPMLLVGIYNEKILKMDFSKNMGIICGVMTNPNALAYANNEMNNESASEAYATVYPLTTFLRIFIAQILLIFLLG